jgi:DNA-directed RNA polymerase subunit RPC12/RpoP
MPIDQIVDLHDDTKADIELRCPACGSLAFIYPRILADEKPVLCAACGTFVSSYGELRQRFGEQD